MNKTAQVSHCETAKHISYDNGGMVFEITSACYDTQYLYFNDYDHGNYKESVSSCVTMLI